MKKSFLSLLLFVFMVSVLFAQEHKDNDPKEALNKLIEGNLRYINSQTIHPDQTAEVRAEIATRQKPFAIVVTCSDSRVPPEIIFDQGLGDLFVIRVAGNVVDNFELGSVEYAAEHLGVQLVVVLGHERCGAVEAAVKGGKAPGHIASLVNAIKPSVEKAKKEKGDLFENSIKNNTNAVAQKIKNSRPLLAELVKEGKLIVVPARYDLDDGKVIFYEK